MINFESVVVLKFGFLIWIVYGVGGVVGGIKNNGFDYVLFLFYSQIFGLLGLWVVVVIWIVLIVDVVFDLIVGYWLDNLRLKMGWCYLFFYVVVFFVVIVYFFVWNLFLGLEGQFLFVWLLMLIIIVCVGYILFEVLSFSLLVELLQDYDVCILLMLFCYFFVWVGGLMV